MEITGWTRTAILALGAAAGVLVTAGIIHLAKTRAGRRVAGYPRFK